MAKVHYSDDSKQDLVQIGDYIADDLKNPKAALRIVNSIQDAIDNLADFPLMGTLLSAIIEVETDYRFLVCGRYIAFYRSQGEDVRIDRILYGKRDYISILFHDLELD